MSTARHLFLLAGMLACIAGRAQATPEEYFNLAARQYVKEDKRLALRTLDQGLRAHPQDRKLRGLAEALLKNEQQDQQQQQQKQEQQNKEDQEQQKEQDEQARKEEEQKKEEAREQQQQEGDQERMQQPRPGEISQKDAERMLDALERREQDVQQQVRARLRPARRVPVEKDW